MKLLFTLLILVSVSLAQSTKVSALPEWASGITWYQIFPERFANGDTANDPRPGKVFANTTKSALGWEITPWTKNWFTWSNWEENSGMPFREFVQYRRYGGDLKGIIDNIDYLQGLGIGGIYLNPIFDAVSHHKYDGSTYHHIDVNFGPRPALDRAIIAAEKPDDPTTWKWTSADSLFLKLIEEVHKRGMYIIIDGVFNHTGEQFWAFQDLKKNQMNSPYRDWYRVTSFDDPSTSQNEFSYKGWWNASSLPELNRANDDLVDPVKNYIFAATKRWMDPNGDGSTSDGIDGWRLDVVKDAPKNFWPQWSALTRSINPQVYLSAEVWEFSPDVTSATGPFNSLMNYPFATACNDFFNGSLRKISRTKFIEKLRKIEQSYPGIDNGLMNLIDSHDTERLVSMLNNPDREYNRNNDDRNKDYNPAKPAPEVYELQKMVAAFQILYRGAPMIYYGDEVGMWGANDPHCRKPMIWENLSYESEYIGPGSGFGKGFSISKVAVEKDVFNLYRKLIRFRSTSNAVRMGNADFPKLKEEDIFAFTRKHENETVYVFFNRTKEIQLLEFPLKAKGVKDVLTDDYIAINNNVLRIFIWPNSFTVYQHIAD